MKTAIPSVLVIVALSFVAPNARKAHAVSPPPDGSYLNFNTAEGQNALLHRTSGVGNTALGGLSLESVTTGSTLVSVQEPFCSTPETIIRPPGVGTLLGNTTGSQNTANGAFALFSNNNAATRMTASNP